MARHSLASAIETHYRPMAYVNSYIETHYRPMAYVNSFGDQSAEACLTSQCQSSPHRLTYPTVAWTRSSRHLHTRVCVAPPTIL